MLRETADIWKHVSRGVTIRPAVPDDIPALLEMGAMFHEASGFSEFPYISEDCAASLEAFMTMDNFIGLVAHNGEIVIGVIGGILSPVYFNHSSLSGEEVFWWVNPGSPAGTGARLLEALEGEAAARGCHTWQMKSLDRLNSAAMARLYAQRGYRASEHTFIKEL